MLVEGLEALEVLEHILMESTQEPLYVQNLINKVKADLNTLDLILPLIVRNIHAGWYISGDNPCAMVYDKTEHVIDWCGLNEDERKFLKQKLEEWKKKYESK